MATNISGSSARLRQGVITGSAEDTRAIAAAWAAEWPGAEDVIVALHGDLGAGKTTFVQGIARGIGVADPVTSPTFNVYVLHRGHPRLLAHLDAYRLTTADQLDALMIDDFLRSPYCLAIEWPEHVAAWLPPKTLHLDLALTPDQRHAIRLRP